MKMSNRDLNGGPEKIDHCIHSLPNLYFVQFDLVARLIFMGK